MREAQEKEKAKREEAKKNQQNKCLQKARKRNLKGLMRYFENSREKYTKRIESSKKKKTPAHY
jgi:hypothetical protein